MAKWKYFFILFIVSFTSLRGQSGFDTIVLNKHAIPVKGIRVLPHTRILEDQDKVVTYDKALNYKPYFSDAATFEKKYALSTYWLVANIANNSDDSESYVLKFGVLSHVEMFLFDNQDLVVNEKSGTLRNNSELGENKDRQSIRMPMGAGKTYTLLIKVDHMKGYFPVFDFEIQSEKAYYEQVLMQKVMDAFLEGAICLLLIYSFLSWVLSRFRSYLWLMIYMLGFGLYSISLGGYFINWFFPEDAINGWVFTVHFLHLASIGLYFLIRDFWDLPRKDPVVNNAFMVVLIIILNLVIASFILQFYFHKFNVSTYVNAIINLICIKVVIWGAIRCWKKLTVAQKFVGYALGVTLASSVYLSFAFLFIKEQSIIQSYYIGYVTCLVVGIIISLGIKEQYRQNEVDKQNVLAELNEVRSSQNEKLEAEVRQRTNDLLITTAKISEQNIQLEEQNFKINILMNEFRHRVKNNFSMLKKYIKMNADKVSEPTAEKIINTLEGKIAVMQIVNETLFHQDDTSEFNLNEFFRDIVNYSREIVVNKYPGTQIYIDDEKEIYLQGKYSLHLGLILLELITCTQKGAFKTDTTPYIFIHISASAEQLLILYKDNNDELNYHELTKDTDNTQGIAMINNLTAQLKGTLAYEYNEGSIYTFKFPLSTKDLG